MKKKGFAITSIIYAILILFLVLVFGILSLLGSRKLAFDKLKNDVMAKLNGEGESNSLYGVSEPQLVDRLIPVIYKDNNWVVANTNEKWYDYANKEWANAVVLENNISKNVGDTLNVATEVAMMYVWIPRYEYSIPEYNIGRTDSDIHAIDIKFISNKKTTADEGYNLHPGFKFGDEEVSGLWVGKFETTGQTAGTQTNFTCTNENCTQKVTIKPSYMAAYGKVSNQFYAARSIQTQYGLTNVDSHMAKYTEWTAISYLTNSIYGRCSDETHCTEVTINNSSSYYTGNAGNEISASSAAGITNAYDTIKGQLASTTGNITGVYDMSGGAVENVMGVLLDSSGNPRSGGSSSYNSGFKGAYSSGSNTTGLDFPDSKYYDTFASSNSSTGNYSVITHVNGLTSDYRGLFREWLASPYSATNTVYGDKSGVVTAGYPWFRLGGASNENTASGIFFSVGNDGRATNAAGFRTVLIAQQ